MQRKMTHEEYSWLRSKTHHPNGKPRRKSAKFKEGDIRITFPRGPGPKLPATADPAALASALAVPPVETRAQRRERLRG